MEQEVKFVYTLDHSDVTNKAKDIKQEIHQNAKEVEKLGVTTDEFVKTVNELMSSFGKLTTAVDKNTEAQKKTGEAGKEAAEKEKKGADEATKSIHRTKEEADSLSGSFGKLTKYAAGFFTLQAAQGFIKKVFDVRSEIQSLHTSFETLVGDKGKADALFNSIKEFAVSTPMQMKDLASAAQTMMSFNIPVEQIMENLKAIGDVSMGDTQKFQSLSLAFSQMSATGKLMGQDLLQMINAGFNPLATISEKTGKSIKELKDEMSAGAISADMVRQAFIDATSEGGKFAGMLEAQSKTLSGQWSNLQGAVDDALNGIGESTEGVMNTAIEAATFLVKHYSEVVKILGVVAATYGTYKAAVMAVTAVEKVQAMSRLAHLKGMTLLQLATDLLTKKTALLNATMLANPYVLCATAIAGLVSALVLFTKHTDAAAESQRKINETFAQTQAEIASEQKKIDELFDTLRKAKKGTDAYKTAKDNILSQYGQYLNGLSREVSSLQNVEAAYKAVSRAARDAAMARGMEAAMRGIQDEYNSNYSDNYDRIRKALSGKYGEEAVSRIMNTLQEDLRVNGKISDKNKQILKNYFYGEANFGRMEAWITGLNNNERNFNEARRLAHEKFGNPEKPKITTSETAVTRNKSVIEEEKKAAQAQLDALSVIEAKGKKGDALRKKIEGYDKELEEAFSTSRNRKGTGAAHGGRSSGHDPAVDAAKERQRLFKQQMEEEERLAEERQKMEDAIEDTAVAGIANSGERERMERQVQHERNMRQIDEQEEAFKKAAYKRAEDEFNATNKDKKKVFSDTEVGAAGWQGMVLSEDQQRLIQAQRDKENAEYQRMLDERRRQESQYLIDYIKEYGSIQDRKAAITKEYDQKIAEESNAIQKAALEKEKQQAISDLNFKEWQQSIDWEAVFNDLDRQSTSALKELKDKLRSALRADDITAENAKVLAEKIRETEDLLSQRKNPIAAWLPGMRERVRLSNEAKVAEEELAAATERRNELMARQAKLSMDNTANILQLQERARSLAKATGRNISDKDITADKIMSMTADDWVRLIGLDPISEQAKNVREEFSRLVVTSYDLEKAQEDVRKAQENAAKRRNAFSEFTKGGSVGQYFKDITAGMDFAGWSNYISQQAQGMSELVDNIGLGSTEFGEKVHDFADGVSGFNNAVQSLASGDVFGAINGVIDGFQGFGHMLGIGGGNSKEVMTTIERLTQRNEILTQSIDNLTEAMQKSSGEKAILQYEKLVESQKELNENLLKQLTEQMRYHNAHGSFNSYWGGFSDSDIADFNRRNGTSWNGDLSTLTPEIAKMLMGSPDMLEQIMETGKGGYGERVAERIQALAEQAGLLDEYMENLRETITGTSFDNVFSDFMSALNDLANGSEDVFENVAENWEKMMNQMVLNNLVGNKYKEKLREWYEQRDAIYNTASGGDGKIDPEEIANLRRGYNDILQQAADEVNTLKESGLLTSPDAMNAQEQSASVTATERITTDQAEEIIGRLNVGQILWQQHKDISAQILTNITAMNDLVSGNRQSLTEIVTILQTTNGTLATMLTVNKKIYDEFGLKLDDISQHIRDSYA